jgi:transcriptional regulator with XRE-family HTH domain
MKTQHLFYCFIDITFCLVYYEDMGNTTQLASRVIKWREESNLTQKEVAERLGISRQRYILVEKGERDLSTVELKILSDLFGIMPDDLLKDPIDLPKFRQMYFACIKYGKDERGGIPKTKLAKLLYLSDFTQYYRQLEPMSGVKYRRLEYGPVADVFFSLTDALWQTGKIELTPLDKAQLISATSREAENFDKLTADELKLIKDICAQWKGKRTEEIVNFTHEQLPWQVCRDGEFIPYELIIQEEPDNVFKPITR